MTTYVEVIPGVAISATLNGRRLTKTLVRDLMRDHPEYDWLRLAGGGYVGGGDALRHDLTLQVKRPVTGFSGHPDTVCMINYQADSTREFGYQAVVS